MSGQAKRLAAVRSRPRASVAGAALQDASAWAVFEVLYEEQEVVYEEQEVVYDEQEALYEGTSRSSLPNLAAHTMSS